MTCVTSFCNCLIPPRAQDHAHTGRSELSSKSEDCASNQFRSISSIITAPTLDRTSIRAVARAINGINRQNRRPERLERAAGPRPKTLCRVDGWDLKSSMNKTSALLVVSALCVLCALARADGTTPRVPTLRELNPPVGVKLSVNTTCRPTFGTPNAWTFQLNRHKRRLA